MRSTLVCTAPALLFALALGCSKSPAPSQPGTEAAPASIDARLVTLKVEGMV